MPQGPAELHEKFGDDWNASTQLGVLGFRFDRTGCVLPPVGRTLIMPCENEALDYLWLEWDYGWRADTVLLLTDQYTGSERHVNYLMFASQFQLDNFGYFECVFPPSLQVAMMPVKSDANTISDFIDEMKRKLYAVFRLR